MFKKLRNRFLLLNLLIISVMMLIAFAAIYLITYQNVSKDIDMELHRISEFYRKPQGNPGPKPSHGNSMSTSPKGEEPPAQRSVSFSLVTDSQKKLLSFTSVFSMSSEFYESAKEEAFAQNRDTGDFSLDGNQWAFMVSPAPEGYRISFMDITSQKAILMNMIYTFVLVASVMLIFIFFISRFFANRSIKPVREAFQKQKQFIADASHELKTPLAIINTNVDVLLTNDEDTVKNQSKWLHYIKSEAERMSKLTNDLLYLTQMDDSDMKLIYAPFNMSEAVENVILTMEAVIFEHHISLHYDLAPNLMAFGNSEQIQQVVMILLDNALKYTNPQGTVEISLRRSHGTAVLSVMNSGDGIAEEHLERIFDRFYRMDKSRSRKLGGYGLGLSISKAIVEGHKGKIYARSVLDSSTTFYVELPLSGA